MLTGHAAVALIARERLPASSMVVLMLAAYLPDLASFALQAAGMAGYAADQHSHAVPAVIALAAVAGLLSHLSGTSRRTTAGTALVALSHAPLDFITGAAKPLWAFGPAGGLGLYRHDLADFIVEAGLAGVGILLWMRRPREPVDRDSRRAAISLLTAAVVAQGLYNLGSGYRPARRAWRRAYRRWLQRL